MAAPIATGTAATSSCPHRRCSHARRFIGRSSGCHFEVKVPVLSRGSRSPRRMGMLLVVLSEQILAVVVAVRGPDYRVHVRDVRQGRVQQVPEPDRTLMVELDQDHGTLDAIVEDTAWFG